MAYVKISVAGPVGSGKTALIEALSRRMAEVYSIGVITNDIYTKADASSRFFLQDILSCGRTAYEERFAYRRFSSKVRITRGNELIYRDNTRYEPDQMPMEGMGMYEGYTHMANLFLSGPCTQLQEPIWDVLENYEGEGGVTALTQGDLAVRIFGMRAQQLQQTAEAIRQLYENSF